jgi:hypothetical protein
MFYPAYGVCAVYRGILNRLASLGQTWDERYAVKGQHSFLRTFKLIVNNVSIAVMRNFEVEGTLGQCEIINLYTNYIQD